MDKRRDDWICVKCNDLNFGRNEKCRKCGCGRSRPGDWICGRCKDHVFASKSSCSKCGMSKSQNQPTKTTKTVYNDWTCPNCNFLVYGSKSSCSKCNFKRSELPPVPNPAPVPNPISNPTNDDTCIICMDRVRNFVIVSCGHLCYCEVCGFTTNKCPLCRKEYDPEKDLLKVYL